MMRPASIFCRERRFTHSGANRHLIIALMQQARVLWPAKTASQLVVITGVSERAAKYWLARKRGISAEALAALLRSEQGFEFLKATIGNDRPAWWRQFERRVRVAQLIEKQKMLREELEAIEREASNRVA